MIYLDNSATTKPDASVLASFIKVNEELWYNPSSIHAGGEQANKLLETARAQVATVLKTKAKSVVFTSGGTESSNFVLRQTALEKKDIGRHILLSAVEHPSVREVGLYLAQQGYEVEWLDVDQTGTVLPSELKQKIRKDTIIVSVQHVNNEIGTIQPIKELVAITRNHSRASFHVDAVQSFGKLPVDFEQLPVDWITLSSHKYHGLKGSGIAACNRSITLEPFILGGGQESGYRSGTTAVAQAVSTARATRLAFEEQQQNFIRLTKMQRILRKAVTELPLVTILTPELAAPHILSVAVKGVKGEVLVNALEKKGIYVSTSSACSSKKTSTSHVLEAMGVSKELIDGVIRISMSKDTTEQEIESFNQTFQEILQLLERNLHT